MRGTGLSKPWGVKAGGYLGGRSCPRGIHVKDHQLLQRHVKPQARSSQQGEPELITVLPPQREEAGGSDW